MTKGVAQLSIISHSQTVASKNPFPFLFQVTILLQIHTFFSHLQPELRFLQVIMRVPYAPSSQTKEEHLIFMTSSKTCIQTIFFGTYRSPPNQLERRFKNGVESVNYDLISSTAHMLQTIIKFE
ncbi:hypothetical protein TNIN_234671 [Trichonephila inaurata madagascariensis]|uniref:Uncharacterized protein n=1 Tax=Trichonephila inaurata madagascariensis TaxID=2747483 RepID=A0A8X6MAW7_9ARAC|nr:hypothetical protein TNIN_234671 [Trichonephila inaurata madagascariensis]